MSLIIASLVLALAALMGMIAAAVLAYVGWNGLMCVLEPGGRHMTALQQILSALFAPTGESPNYSPGSAGVRTEPDVLWHGYRGPGATPPNLRGALQANARGQAPIRNPRLLEEHDPPAVVEVDVTPPRRHRPRAAAEEMSPAVLSPPPRRRPVRSDTELSPAAMALRPKLSREPLLRGLAAQLALRFSGDLPFHVANVQAVAEAYELNAADLCYCFLCLESASGGSGLALKKWATGTYAARVWLVALARFVKTAQRLRGAKDETRLEPLCNEWRYKQDFFVQELLACELPFQREHGKALLEAFQSEEIRRPEVSRASRIMMQHAGMTTAGGNSSGGQLSLPNSVAALEDGSTARKEAQGKRPRDEGTVALTRKKGRQSF